MNVEPLWDNGRVPYRRNRVADASVQVLIVGSGKLAAELVGNLKSRSIVSVIPWSKKDERLECSSIVVHAGSGRELQSVVSFCSSSHSVLIELSTGGNLAEQDHPFPIVLCPNINILMLKFMAMLQSHGHLFREYQTTILESHSGDKDFCAGSRTEMIRSASTLGVTAFKWPVRHD